MPTDPPPKRKHVEPQPIDLSGLAMHSIHDRRHLSQIDAQAGLPEPGASFGDWFASLPGFYGAQRLRSAVSAILDARRADRPVVFAIGGHVVKVGCSPIVIDLMQRGMVTAVAGNGATAIHDVELAMIGATSEDVGETIRDGRFGMVAETAEFFADAARRAMERGVGYGAAIGQLILDRGLPHASRSILAAAVSRGLPITIHVALGTDTVHMSPAADGAAIGAASLADFRILCEVVRRMGAAGAGGPCGTWVNVGSAVILPEVFLKAVSIARNLGADLDALTAVNLDQLRHYRPSQNVVGRPVAPGRGHDIAGQHEILLPLLRQALVEAAAS
jgi:hypothetical protein